MAGTGRKPKPQSERRNRAAPQRGDWKDLAPHENPVPEMPQGDFSERTIRVWRAWWEDPVSAEWGSADVTLVETLAYTYEEWARNGGPALVTQVRQQMDTLGLTPKGRQDRRWKLPDAADIVPIEEAKSASERMEDLRKRAASAEGVA